MQDDTYLNDYLVRYGDLIPCTTAFIDTRTPGSQEKENFTIIGPGVSENPDQHVHIPRPHGFNIGGARQPPHCVNSQHSHETAEVFVVHSGEWRFTTGETGEDGEVFLHPGDTISIPTRCFRGFENVGQDEGFLFAVLGEDDPGRVTWAPYVFENAKEYGLVLLENGNLIDTAAGETVPEDALPMPVTTPDDVQALARLDSDALEGCVARHQDLNAVSSDLGSGISEAPIIGTEPLQSQTGEGNPPLAWRHGFQVRHMKLEPNAQTQIYTSSSEEVLLIQSGRLTVNINERDITLEPGDVLSLEIEKPRRITNNTNTPAEIYVIHGGDSLGLKVHGDKS